MLLGAGSYANARRAMRLDCKWEAHAGAVLVSRCGSPQGEDFVREAVGGPGQQFAAVLIAQQAVVAIAIEVVEEKMVQRGNAIVRLHTASVGSVESGWFLRSYHRIRRGIKRMRAIGGQGGRV